MNFFRIGFGKPLDKVAKFMAILDLVLAFLVCVLTIVEIYKIRIEAAETHGGHDLGNLTTYEAVRHHAEEIAERKMPTGGILSLVASFIVVAFEVYLCRLLYGGAKHGDEKTLKSWWLGRMILDIFGCTNTMVRIVLIVRNKIDAVYVLIYVYRAYEMILVWKFRNELI